MRPPDFADLIELLAPEQRVRLVGALDHALDPEVFSELDEAVRDQTLRSAAERRAGQSHRRAAIRTTPPTCSENLEESDQKEILRPALAGGDRAAVERNLEYPDETAGRLMQADFVAVAAVLDRRPGHRPHARSRDLPETFSEIFVVDPRFRVLGSVDISRLLRLKRDIPYRQDHGRRPPPGAGDGTRKIGSRASSSATA